MALGYNIGAPKKGQRTWGMEAPVSFKFPEKV
jgi:hypothetical protein